MISRTETFVAYTANGTQNSFSFEFYVQRLEDLKIYSETTAGVRSDITGYISSVIGIGNQSGGSVTLSITPSYLTKVFIVRLSAFTQTWNASALNLFDPVDVEQVVDKLTMLAQEAKSVAQSSIRLDSGETLTPLLRSDRKGKLVGFNSTDGSFEYTDKAAFTTSVSNAAVAAIQPSVDAAANSASAASGSASAAAGSASSASGFASAASGSASAAAGSVSLASGYASTAAGHASDALDYASTSQDAYNNLITLGVLTNADKGVANGVASLDSSSKVPTSQIPTTGLSIKLRQGTEAERLGTLFDIGEPAYTTDNKTLWIGDGVTTGGGFVGGVCYYLAPSHVGGSPTPVDPRFYFSFPVIGPGIRTSSGGTGSVGTSTSLSNIRPYIQMGGFGGRNHSTGSGNGGNAGSFTGTAGSYSTIVIGPGDGGNAGQVSNGGAGGPTIAANGFGLFTIKAGLGGDGHSTGTGAGGAGGRLASFCILGGKGGNGGTSSAGGSGGGSTIFSGTLSGVGFYLRGGDGGIGDAAVGGGGGRLGSVQIVAGNGGNASGATAGGVGGNGGNLLMNGSNASGTVAGFDSGNINVSAGANFAGGSIDLSNGKLDLIVRGTTGQLGMRVAVPANSTAAGIQGQWASDDSFFYYYGATGWRRIAGSVF